METSGKILTIGGGLLAIVVAGLVSFLLAHQPAAVAPLPVGQVVAAAPPNTAPVLIATRSIPRGTTIHASDVARLFKQVDEPQATVVTQTVFADPAQLSALLSVVPRQTTAPIAAGQQLAAPLLSGLAVPQAAPASLAATLPRGFDGEAVAIPVAHRAVNGAIAVDDRVDVVYSVSPHNASGDAEPRYSAMLIQGATVVAASPVSGTYTLAVSPQDAVRLAHAKDANWNLHLVLRSVYDGAATRQTYAVTSATIRR